MNLSNRLTLSRIIVIPFFMIALLPQEFGFDERWNPAMRLLALVLFVAASITDYYDGALARRHGWITNFGTLMDPLADKVLVMAAFVGMVQLEFRDQDSVFPAWMVVLILAREFLITGLRQLASAKGRVLAADRWGQNKTISQLTTIITALVFLAARDWLKHFGLWDHEILRRWEVAWVLETILLIMMWWCVALTVISGWRYCSSNRDVFMEDS